ncbi:hypothetical protein ACHAW5_003240 [Stephanodiscus triporus]|uniref:Mitochondrial carrier protein n=1 Tax=Stephanodiscus triporus TaxID=2934178 RepID=A0ABD3P5R8_9STRA
MSSIESNASLIIISPDIPKTLIYCQSSSTITTPTLVLESERSITATSMSSATCTTPALALKSESTSVTSSPSRSTSSAISSAAEAHQLSPVVHAIGGSVGSALAILLCYPLERVRLELLSRADSTSSVEPGQCTSGRNDGNLSNLHSSLRVTATENDLLEIQVEEVVSNNSSANSQREVKYDESLATPASPTESFELVPSIKSFDAASMGTLSYDEGGYDNEEISCESLVGRAQQFDSSDTNSAPIVVCSTGTSERDTEPSRSTSRPSSIPTQSHETIAQCLLRLQAEGSLYKGASHVVTTLMISNAIFFYSLQVIRRRLSSLGENSGSHQLELRYPLSYFLHIISTTSNIGRSLISSTLAGCINVLLTNPLWVASLRVMEEDKSQKRQNIWQIMYRIVQNEGVSQLWNGTYTSLLLVSNPIIQHFAYEQFRFWFLKGCRKQSFLGSRNGSSSKISYGGVGKAVSLKAASLTPLEAFVCGALAKTVATVITYPLQLAQTLLRLQKKSSPSPITNNRDYGDELYHKGTFDCLYQQFSSGGIRALFHGMNAKMLQTVLTAAFTFLTYEQILTCVGRIYDAMVLRIALLRHRDGNGRTWLTTHCTYANHIRENFKDWCLAYRTYLNPNHA